MSTFLPADLQRDLLKVQEACRSLQKEITSASDSLVHFYTCFYCDATLPSIALPKDQRRISEFLGMPEC